MKWLGTMLVILLFVIAIEMKNAKPCEMQSRASIFCTEAVDVPHGRGS